MVSTIDRPHGENRVDTPATTDAITSEVMSQPLSN